MARGANVEGPVVFAGFGDLGADGIDKDVAGVFGPDGVPEDRCFVQPAGVVQRVFSAGRLKRGGAGQRRPLGGKK